ncbi:hypothetical protein C922_04759 [Plasmodium inui San Antonio 1]|uniref:RNase NYN domain-containing protein n=1 Tax=Plasmodium inui San Antonio 1 TaxID=1237626 RepID=W6ZVL8_9APIC|nr:hypothetical protein C922_04759 [Plasmodium inui San Antonio 1]EUD64812.1 hypothetical protein C922_04759 [Plasmodium inui San Antonio 1]
MQQISEGKRQIIEGQRKITEGKQSLGVLDDAADVLDNGDGVLGNGDGVLGNEAVGKEQLAGGKNDRRDKSPKLKTNIKADCAAVGTSSKGENRNNKKRNDVGGNVLNAEDVERSPVRAEQTMRERPEGEAKGLIFPSDIKLIYGSITITDRKENPNVKKKVTALFSKNLYDVVLLYYEMHFYNNIDSFQVDVNVYEIYNDLICLIDELYSMYIIDSEKKQSCYVSGDMVERYLSRELSGGWTERTQEELLQEYYILKGDRNILFINFKLMKMVYLSAVFDLEFFGDVCQERVFLSEGGPISGDKGVHGSSGVDSVRGCSSDIDVCSVSCSSGDTPVDNGDRRAAPPGRAIEAPWHDNRGEKKKSNKKKGISKRADRRSDRREITSPVLKSEALRHQDGKSMEANAGREDEEEEVFPIEETSPVEEAPPFEESYIREDQKLCYRILCDEQPYKALLIKDELNLSSSDDGDSYHEGATTSVKEVTSSSPLRGVEQNRATALSIDSSVNLGSLANLTISSNITSLGNVLSCASAEGSHPASSENERDSITQGRHSRVYTKSKRNKGILSYASPHEKSISIPKDILNITSLLSTPILSLSNLKSLNQVNFSYGYSRTKKELYNYCYAYLVSIHNGYDVIPMEGYKFRPIIIDGANVSAKVIHKPISNVVDSDMSIIYDCFLLHEAYVFFKRKKVDDIIIVLNPVTKKGEEYFLGNKKVCNYSYLESLIKQNAILICNEKYYHSYKGDVVKRRTYDDVLILELASHRNGCVISNDNYTDIEADTACEEIKHVISHYVVKHHYDKHTGFGLDMTKKPLKFVLNSLFQKID